jgi:2-C-methyl-D-erythritol 4-phosphate cytidylyltransferase / 2-C-methyl-D-erythritol 2,4-cyclodiphosphate synthase
MRIAAVLVAAGAGTRFGTDTPKQFLPLAGRPVIRHAAETLAGCTELLQPVGDPNAITRALTDLPTLPPVPGGATRQESVRAGLEALVPHAPDIVLVHDAARPHIPPGTIPALLSRLETTPGAIPALAVADTLKRVKNERIAANVRRDGLYRAQTPQAFHFPVLLRAHGSDITAATDDAALLEAIGEPVAIILGSDDNIKITYPEDLMRLERILSGRLIPRTGAGFDVHALQPGRPLILCGIRIRHEQGLAGHSDADVGIHALCDAIYGALAEGDIGHHFPPSDVAWKDADSAHFLSHAADRIAARRGILANADITLICERPKISPHADAMRRRLADLLHTTPERISVKATTTEHLGFTGRSEGIAAQAVATILLPWNGLPS